MLPDIVVALSKHAAKFLVICAHREPPTWSHHIKNLTKPNHQPPKPSNKPAEPPTEN